MSSGGCSGEDVCLPGSCVAPRKARYGSAQGGISPGNLSSFPMSPLLPIPAQKALQHFASFSLFIPRSCQCGCGPSPGHRQGKALILAHITTRKALAGEVASFAKTLTSSITARQNLAWVESLS